MDKISDFTKTKKKRRNELSAWQSCSIWIMEDSIIKISVTSLSCFPIPKRSQKGNIIPLKPEKGYHQYYKHAWDKNPYTATSPAKHWIKVLIIYRFLVFLFFPFSLFTVWVKKLQHIQKKEEKNATNSKDVHLTFVFLALLFGNSTLLYPASFV